MLRPNHRRLSLLRLMQGADSGHVHNNMLLWQCSAFDMDGTSRVLFEDNTITCTQARMIPHVRSKRLAPQNTSRY